MTDLIKLQKLFDDFGIKYQVDANGTIECHSGTEKVTGYWGFFTYFEFTKEGKFVEMGAAE